MANRSIMDNTNREVSFQMYQHTMRSAEEHHTWCRPVNSLCRPHTCSSEGNRSGVMGSGVEDSPLITGSPLWTSKVGLLASILGRPVPPGSQCYGRLPPQGLHDVEMV